MNWKLLIADLKARGWTEVRIAASCDCSQGNINALGQGINTAPRYELGAKLRVLHERADSGQAKPSAPGSHVTN